jgi:hypothetical protein
MEKMEKAWRYTIFFEKQFSRKFDWKIGVAELKSECPLAPKIVGIKPVKVPQLGMSWGDSEADN